VSKQSEIDRPLGQDRVQASPRRLPSARAMLGVLLVLGLVAAAGMVAMRDQPFRKPVNEVEAAHDSAPAAPATEVAANAAPVARPEPPLPADGPKIVKLPPSDEPRTTGTIVIRDPAGLGQNLRVAHLPDRSLLEETPAGPLPVRSAEGVRPVDVYARQWSGARGARVAIVLGGFAISQTGTQAAIEKLPPEVTIAFSPQGNSIGRWMEAARRKGHEVLIQLPLEPFDYPNVDPGRNTLTVDAAAEENLDRLHWAMARTTNYTGLMNFMGARFSSDSAAMQPVLAEIGKRGLLYFDDGMSARTVAPELALRNGVPFAAGDLAIDAVRERGAVLKKLDELERIARAKGVAVGSGAAFAETVDAVTSWIAEAKRRGIEIVPISAVTVDPERS
jgi:polysaccharide deacetylase 2 family uncharacterized protein YibQ